MTQDEVLKLTGSLDDNKTTGMDGVSPKLLTMAELVLTEPFT